MKKLAQEAEKGIGKENRAADRAGTGLALAAILLLQRLPYSGLQRYGALLGVYFNLPLFASGRYLQIAARNPGTRYWLPTCSHGGTKEKADGMYLSHSWRYFSKPSSRDGRLNNQKVGWFVWHWREDLIRTNYTNYMYADQPWPGS